MTKPSTHVIELERGTGEPASIPLTLGSELQPISIGKKGMWRIASERLLDVHAFVYFDGAALFIQSADDASAASVDGYRVGKAWTELHAPCAIEIGDVRLRFRSVTDVSAEPPPQAVAAPSPRHRSPTGPNPAMQYESSGDEAPVARPFAPGEFASAPQEGGSTRVKPLEGSWNGGPARSPEAPRPAAGRGIGEPDATKIERGTGRGGANAAARDGSPRDYPSPHQEGTEVMPHHPVATPGMMRGGAMGNPTPPPNMYPHTQPSARPAMYAPGGMPPGSMAPIPPAMTPREYMRHPTGPQQPYAGSAMGAPYNPEFGQPGGGAGSQGSPGEGRFADYIAKYKELSPPKRILVILAPFCLVASVYLLLFDDPQPRAPQHASASVDAGTAAAATAAVKPPAPASCPPGYVPWSTPAANGVIACVPAPTAPGSNPTPGANSTATPPPPLPGTTQNPAPTPPTSPNVDAGAASTKTLERQAVDYLAANDYARAASIYETLQAQNPNNRVYAEAARILRAKANGAP